MSYVVTVMLVSSIMVMRLRCACGPGFGIGECGRECDGDCRRGGSCAVGLRFLRLLRWGLSLELGCWPNGAFCGFVDGLVLWRVCGGYLVCRGGFAPR